MKVMVVGEGGREHAISWKLAQDDEVKKIYCTPGNAGNELMDKCESIEIGAEEIDKLAEFAKEKKPDLTVVGPEGPLLKGKGIADIFEEMGLNIFAPRKGAALIEGSKAFNAELCQLYGIPIPESAIFHTYKGALEYSERKWRDDYKIVPKGDGLAGGKAVIVCDTLDEEREALKILMVERKYGDAGDTVVLQKMLYGEELSTTNLVDKNGDFLELETSQDHKPLEDGDRGPNTGGMGAYSPAPVARGHGKAIRDITTGTISALYGVGKPFKGVLYGAIMISEGSPYKLEDNARFGDPEIQPILFRMKSNLVPYLIACIEGNLRKMKPPEWDPRPAVCVVVASKGYPGSYEKGKLITGLDDIAKMEDVYVFHAGTKKENGNIYTSGGRVLGVTARGRYGNDFEGAKEKAYEAVKMIKFDGSIEGVDYRTDISDKALIHIQV